MTALAHLAWVPNERAIRHMARTDALVDRMLATGRTPLQVYWSEIHGDSAMLNAYQKARDEL